MPESSEKRACRGVNRAGEPCAAAPLRESEWCAAHDPVSPADTRFGGSEQAAEAGSLGGKAGRVPGVMEVMRQRVEEKAEMLLAPYFEAAENAVIFDKVEGAHWPTEYPDLTARQVAADRLFDRVFGKPRQATELSGPNGGAIPVSDVDIADPDTRRLIGELLRRRPAARDE